MTQRTKNSSPRNKDQREKDLLRTAKLRLEGYSQYEIAKDLEVSQQQVSLDMKELRRRWAKRTESAAEEMIAEEMAKIDRVERTHWEGYWKSILTELDEEGERIPINGGDPRFLQGVERCIAKRIEIFGATTKENPSDFVNQLRDFLAATSLLTDDADLDEKSDTDTPQMD